MLDLHTQTPRNHTTNFPRQRASDKFKLAVQATGLSVIKSRHLWAPISLAGKGCSLSELDGAFHIISYVPICFFKWASNLLMHLCTPVYIYKPEEFINWFISDIPTLLLGK